MVDWLALFQNFGYPALISGVLLYILHYKLERVITEIIATKEELIKLNAVLPEYRQDVKELLSIVDRRFLSNRRDAERRDAE